MFVPLSERNNPPVHNRLQTLSKIWKQGKAERLICIHSVGQ